SDGSLFEAIAAPPGELAPSTTFHSELTHDEIAAGLPAAEVVQRFAAFARPDDVVCSWGTYAPSLFAAHGGVLPQARLDLRFFAQRYANGRVGGLENYVGEVEPLARGRAGRRLAMLASLLRTWRAALS
ncbi:MAG TPA: hypothetical protein VLT45_23115, partial [Kofleriaceae bacterium]|nr:hypothetical protein [Kofleriaceae bacterium]